MLDVVSPFILWPIECSSAVCCSSRSRSAVRARDNQLCPAASTRDQFRRNMEVCLMPDVVSPFILWPIGHWSASGRAHGPSDERLPDRRIY